MKKRKKRSVSALAVGVNPERAAKLVEDRAFKVMNELEKERYDWDEMLQVACVLVVQFLLGVITNVELDKKIKETKRFIENETRRQWA